MNTEYIYNRVKPYLINNKFLREDDFNKLFSIYSKHLQYNIVAALIDINIDILYEEDDLNFEFCRTNNALNSGTKIDAIKESTGLDNDDKLSQNYHINIEGSLKNISNEQLCVVYQNGNELAMNVLINKNKKLIYSRVRKYSKVYNHDLDDDDLFQYGAIGFMKAVEKFDVKMDNLLSTYAIYWIDQLIMRSIADYGFSVRVPVHMFELINKYNKIMKNNPAIDAGEAYEYFTKEIDCSYEKFQFMLNIRHNIMNLQSINVLVGEEGDTELENLIADTSITVEDEVDNLVLKDNINYVLKSLKPREENVIKLRYGIDDGIQRSLEEVGQIYNLTRERIRQIEAKGFRKLKHSTRSIYIKDFYES